MKKSKAKLKKRQAKKRAKKIAQLVDILIGPNALLDDLTWQTDEPVGRGLPVVKWVNLYSKETAQ